MKLLIYGMTEDEKKILAEIRQQVDVEEIAFADGIFTKDRIAEVDGFRAIWIMTNSMIGEEEARLLSEHGVRYIVSGRPASIILTSKHCGSTALRQPMCRRIHPMRSASIR